MKKNILLTIGLTLIIGVSLVVLSVNNQETYSVYANAGGSPGGKTDSPGDGANCTQCHNGTLNPGGSVMVLISSTGLASGYTPGQTYTVNATITGTSSSKIGFEVTAEKDLDDSKIGSIIITDAVRTKTVNSGNAITHNSAAGTTASSGSNAWSFDWTAPIAGTGDVTFYGAFNATNSSGNAQGDLIYSATFNVTENITTGVELINPNSTITLFPNPAKTYFQISTNLDVEYVQVLALDGQKVLEANPFQNRINIKNLSLGVYFVKIKTTEGVTVEKLIIQ